MTIHDRMKLVIKWLIGTGVANNQEAIGRLIGYTNKSSFSQILNNKVSVPSDFVDRLCNLDKNINKVWVKHGVGDMIFDGQEHTLPSKAQSLDLEGDAAIYYKMYQDEKSENRALIEEIGGLKERIRQLESNAITEPKGLGAAKDVSIKKRSSSQTDDAGSAIVR